MCVWGQISGQVPLSNQVLTIKMCGHCLYIQSLTAFPLRGFGSIAGLAWIDPDEGGMGEQVWSSLRFVLKKKCFISVENYASSIV